MPKLTIEEMRKLANKKGGKCLSTTYVNNRTKLTWECSKGHRWDAVPWSIQNGTWCPQCSKYHKKIDVKDLNEFAKTKGGALLSKKFLGMHKKHQWICSEKHIWEASPSNVKNNGSWCPYCYGRIVTIEDMHRLATSRNGKCLSENYKTSNAKLRWMCAEGHIWSATPNSIQNGKWCPECVKFNQFSESIVKTTFEQIFGKPFRKVKPNWLKNSKGNLMELDGYCEDLSIAFEYQGEQHFSVHRFSPDDETLVRRIGDDKIKRHLCRKHGVQLFIINHTEDLRVLPSEIKKQCVTLGIETKLYNFNRTINFNSVYFHKTKIHEMQQLAKRKGGHCLSKKYTGVNSKLKWSCSKGHTWEAIPSSIKNGTWCPYCSKRPPLTIAEMEETAKKRGGVCLSKIYVNAKTKLEWKCELGHVWDATPDSIRNKNSWCPICNTQKRK